MAAGIDVVAPAPQSALAITVQLLPSILLSGCGMLAAGALLDIIQVGGCL